MFRHNEKSWKEMWKQVGKTTGSSWDVKVWLDEDEDFGQYRKNEGNGLDNKLDSGDRRLTFEVTKIGFEVAKSCSSSVVRLMLSLMSWDRDYPIRNLADTVCSS